MNLIACANIYSLDRRAHIGILALEVNQYLGTEIISAGPPILSKDIAGSAIEGLQIWSEKSREIPIFHYRSGVYGFLNLPIGQQKIFIVDPSNRYQPYSLLIDVKPERYAVKDFLERGIIPPAGSEGVIETTILLRPAYRFPLPMGKAAVWGQVRDGQGLSLPFTWLEFESQLNGNECKIKTYTDLDGMYLAYFPKERALITGGGGSGRQVEFIRNVDVFRLKPEWLDKIAEQNALSILPPGIDQLSVLEFQSYYLQANNISFLKYGDPNQVASSISIHVEHSVRWDIVIQ
jgi:hypothetical protein